MRSLDLGNSSGTMESRRWLAQEHANDAAAPGMVGKKTRRLSSVTETRLDGVMAFAGDEHKRTARREPVQKSHRVCCVDPRAHEPHTFFMWNF